MSKHLITRLWLAGLGLGVLGGIVLLIGAFMGSANGAGPIAVGWFIALAALVVQLVAWIGALIGTARLERWGWFAALLLLGLVGFEFFVMIAYFFAGPERKEGASPPLPA
jgi:hypothetical protein